MATVTEYRCGCMIHSLAGAIRFCPGLRSKSLRGRVISGDENAAGAHERAMAASPAHVYNVAEVIP